MSAVELSTFKVGAVPGFHNPARPVYMGSPKWEEASGTTVWEEVHAL